MDNETKKILQKIVEVIISLDLAKENTSIKDKPPIMSEGIENNRKHLNNLILELKQYVK